MFDTMLKTKKYIKKQIILLTVYCIIDRV